MSLRRIRALARLVTAVDRADDERLDHAIAAAVRAADPNAPFGDTTQEVLASFGAALSAGVAVAALLEVDGGTGGPFSLRLLFNGEEVRITIDHHGWRRHMAHLRAALGRRGAPIGAAEADAIRAIVESLSQSSGTTLADVTSAPVN